MELTLCRAPQLCQALHLTHREGRGLVGAEPGVGAVIPRVLAVALPAGKGPPSVQQEASPQRFLELKETGMPLR